MLRKLMKQELFATARFMLPLYAAVILLGLGVRFAGFIMDASFPLSVGGGASTVGSLSDLSNTLSALLALGFVLGLLATFLMALVLVVLRFRNNLLGDEGYVMFTLPVSVHQLVWAKLLVSLVWFVGAALVDVLAILLVLAGNDFSLSTLFSGLGDLIYSGGGKSFLLIAEGILLCILCSLLLCLEFYAPMSIGYSFARHKGLLSVAFFFAIQGAAGLFSSCITLIGGQKALSLPLSSLSDFAASQGILLSGLVSNLLYVAVLYWLTTYMLKNRLNLE